MSFLSLSKGRPRPPLLDEEAPIIGDAITQARRDGCKDRPRVFGSVTATIGTPAWIAPTSAVVELSTVTGRPADSTDGE